MGDADGLPLCVSKPDYEAQKHRITVVSVLEGSIIVDFKILANQSEHRHTAVELYDALLRQIKSDTSPLSHDKNFGRFARAAAMVEIPFSSLGEDERSDALGVENRRGSYGTGNMCELHSDTKNGKQ